MARTRSGNPCQSPAIKGAKRCRMHGGKGSGAPEGNRNAWKHGGRSWETAAAHNRIRELCRLIDDLGKNELN
ncbi:HGGxSTG domain-containing protein [Novosphingobium aquae]|uniref:HGGxSTG domain-containing protein n=1 Tax=Novosphingobium aquae TaxID=3133435 RepID=UPI003A912C79